MSVSSVGRIDFTLLVRPFIQTFEGRFCLLSYAGSLGAGGQGRENFTSFRAADLLQDGHGSDRAQLLRARFRTRQQIQQPADAPQLFEGDFSLLRLPQGALDGFAELRELSRRLVAHLEFLVAEIL